MEQVRRAIDLMPIATEIDRRNRALMAFAIVTGMREGAIASTRRERIDLDRQLVWQDPREVKAKFSKTISTTFFPVGDDLKQIVADWVTASTAKRRSCTSWPSLEMLKRATN